MGVKQFGARVQRFEDQNLLQGKGRFIDDISRPDMLYAAFLRSPHGHAKIHSITTAAALEAPGVAHVLTAADLPEHVRTTPLPLLVPNAAMPNAQPQYCLARDEVCYAGEPIAVVLADSRYQAEDALALIDVDYEPLGAASDLATAARPDAATAHAGRENNIAATYTVAYGEIDAAFAAAPHVFRDSIWQHRGGGMAMEPRGTIAEYDADTDALTVWATTQAPHMTQRMMADVMGRSPESIRIITPDVGGGFGPKVIFYPEDGVIPTAAMITGRPIKHIEDRREHFMCATQERDQLWDMEIALDNEGKVLGVRGTMLHDSGAYVPWGIIMPYIASVTVPGPYVLPAYKLDVQVIYTNKVATTPVRGAGRPQAVFVMERLLDRAARELAIDRAEIRRRNFIQPEQMPYSVGLLFRDGRPLIYDSGDYPKGQAAAVTASNYNTFKERQTTALQEGRYIGIGIANYVEGTGLGPFEGVTVRIQQNGKVRVASGATTQGQGTRTTLAQIVADNLDCPIEDIEIVLGDTATISNGVGAFASRLAVNAGNSAMMAASEVRKQVVALAAKTLGVEEADIDVEDGRAMSKRDNKPSVSFGELARRAQGMPGFSMSDEDSVGLEHTGYFKPSQGTYCSGTHIVEVEVDIATGGVTLLNYTVAHDCGTVINPLVVDGQVQGGVAHGLGNALFEWMKYDENAQPLTTSFAEYLIPMATDVPTCQIEHVITPTPLNPLGVKGAGEGGTIPAPAAIVSAIEDALTPFKVKFDKTPLVPEQIIKTLSAAGAFDPAE